MIKSILAVSEGGPDAAVTFGLAARIATLFRGSVDAIHYSEGRAGDFDIAAQSMPFVRSKFDDRLKSREHESERAYGELLASFPGASFTDGRKLTRERLVALGRAADLVVIGRPGEEPEDIAPDTVRAAIYESGRPVVIAPPNVSERPIERAVVAWNGSVQAARAVAFAMPFLDRASSVTVLAPSRAATDEGIAFLMRSLQRHGLVARIDSLSDGDLSARARGRALRDYVRDKGDGFLVMGAYGHGGLANLLGLGGATAKVISSCPVPLLLAH
jgi:nucleotide-binding universal stress UspA family protein